MPAYDQDIFAQYGPQWWQESGPFWPLHSLNPIRLNYIKNQICTHFNSDTDSLSALNGFSILDAGCGGGLISEPLARLGASVTGIDQDPGTIDAAREHCERQGLEINYQTCALQDLSSLDKSYDVVLALELIEHVKDQAGFMEQIAQLCTTGGIVIVSTLNKTWQSWLLGIIGAENVLGWVPRGTHDWHFFLRPNMCAKYMRDYNLKPKDVKGFVFNPLSYSFELSHKCLDINYIITAQKIVRSVRAYNL